MSRAAAIGQHLGRVGDGGEVDQPDAVREVGHRAAADLDGEAGLAGATGTGEGDPAAVLQQTEKLADLAVAADDGGFGRGQVCGELHTQRGRARFAVGRSRGLRRAQRQAVPGEGEANVGQPGLGRAIEELDPLGAFEPIGDVVGESGRFEQEGQDRAVVAPGEHDLLADVARGEGGGRAHQGHRRACL